MNGLLVHRAPPLAVVLPDDPKVRDLHVVPHDLSTYDDLGGGDAS